MNNDQNKAIFADGFSIYSAPQDWLFGKASINVNKFKKFLDEHVNEKGYVNLDFPISNKTNEPYAKLNVYVPKPKPEMTNDQRVASYRDAGMPLDNEEDYDVSSIPF
jgi:hypothetical protein